MAAVWKAYKNAQKEKRIGKGKGSSTNNILRNEMATVQRLSSDVSRKAQKHTRIGPREFVPCEYTDLTMTNLKKAITTHFGSTSFCDILAGEQGPSCKVLEQIPDLKVIYFRFVDQGGSLDEEGKRQGSVGELQNGEGFLITVTRTLLLAQQNLQYLLQVSFIQRACLF